jgi:YD repeat-containing protein
VLATGGGLSCDPRGVIDAEPCWRGCRPGFFLPVRPLSRLFRGKFLAGLRQAHGRGRLRLPAGWREPGRFDARLAGLRGRDRVVYGKPPGAAAGVVLKYLARYTHRVAFSSRRLVGVTEEGVTFTYQDYRRQGRRKEMTLPGGEFVRRFLPHVLPRGFVRVRHYGLLSNRGRPEKLARCRKLLGVGAARPAAVARPARAEEARCPRCGVGLMAAVEWLPRAGPAVGAPACPDSS